MFYFNNISLYSVFANVLTVPFLSVISFGGFVSSVFALFTPISDFVCKVFDFFLNPLLNVLVWISKYFSELPHSLIITTHPSVFQVILYYLILFAFVFVLKTNFSNKKSNFVLLGLIFVLAVSTINIPNHNLEIIAFDVQNGDAFLLKTPQNKYVLIDTGKSGYRGSASKAKMIIVKYLRDKGIKHLDSMILTHFDSDHAGGALDMIENIKVDKIYVNSLNDDSKLAKDIYQIKVIINNNGINDIESYTIITPLDYYSFKEKIQSYVINGSDFSIIEDITKGRELASYNTRFQD